MALNKSRSYNVSKIATLVFTNDEESTAKISDTDVNLPLSYSENKSITSDDSSNEEGEITWLRHSQLCRRHTVKSINTVLIKEHLHPLPDQRNESIPVIIDD